MKKGKNGKSNQKKAFSSSEENNNNNNDSKNVTKEVGIYKGFLVFDKVNDKKENNLNFQTNETSDPDLQDWMIIQHNPSKTKSRFSSLFQEILENDRKMEEQKKKEKQSYEKHLLPNNIIDDVVEDEIKLNENNNIINNNDEINKINEQFDNIKLNKDNKDNNINIINTEDLKEENNNIINEKNNVNPNIINNRKDLYFNNNNFFNQIFNENNIDKNPNINIINNNFPNNNNIYNAENINLNNNQNDNIIKNNNILLNYNPNMNKNNTFNNLNLFNYQDNKFEKYPNSNSSNNNSCYPSAMPTAPSSMDRNNSIFSILSNSSGGYYDNNMIQNNTNNANNNIDYFYFSNKSSFHEPKSGHRPSEKKFDLSIDIKRIIYLEDRRTTLMIKNIPNKFNRDLLLSIIDQNFKSAYDLFILPTDANRYKNFGYSFINFTCSYYIPYFYFLFHRKKWASTNSQKVCEITYSKIQGKNNLLSHYSSKIIFKNEKAKKIDITEEKYTIPNEYFSIFNNAFPNYNVEKHETYFVTKMPFRY